MVNINMVLKKNFEKQFSGTKVEAVESGTNKGIESLLAGEVDIEQHLNFWQQRRKIRDTVKKDAIAIIVGKTNPFPGELTNQEIVDIFAEKINNWSVVGGLSTTIRVINRPVYSGTHQI